MNIYILMPIKLSKGVKDPWNPWYDKAFGFVIRANSEHEARCLANDNAGDENYKRNGINFEKIEPWMDSLYTSCEILDKEGDSEVIMCDFMSA